MKKEVLLFVLGCMSLTAAQGNSPSVSGNASVTRYTIILAGSKAGFETSSQAADGSLLLYYEFNDRGRGPKVNERIVLDKNGIPNEVQNSGNDYLKAPVNETFSLKKGRASWKNRAELGEKQVSSAFYVSISASRKNTRFWRGRCSLREDGYPYCPRVKPPSKNVAISRSRLTARPEQ